MIDPTQISLRGTNRDDFDALTAMCHRTVLAKYPTVIGQEMVEGYVASGAVPEYFEERHSFCRVAEFEGVPVGVYGLRNNAVDLMMVALEHHRTGVGTVLLSHAEASLFASHPQLLLDSFRDNEQAVRFYKKHGWSFEKEFQDPDYGIPMVRLGKAR